MKGIAIIACCFVCSSLFSQLDPFYFGTYLNAAGNESYTVYTMDEVEEDCFIVENDLLTNGTSTRHWEGYGHCNGDNGQMEILFEETNVKWPIEFSILNNGLRSLTLFKPGMNSEVFLEKNE